MTPCTSPTQPPLYITTSPHPHSFPRLTHTSALLIFLTYHSHHIHTSTNISQSYIFLPQTCTCKQHRGHFAHPTPSSWHCRLSSRGRHGKGRRRLCYHTVVIYMQIVITSVSAPDNLAFCGVTLASDPWRISSRWDALPSVPLSSHSKTYTPRQAEAWHLKNNIKKCDYRLCVICYIHLAWQYLFLVSPNHVPRNDALTLNDYINGCYCAKENWI